MIDWSDPWVIGAVVVLLVAFRNLIGSIVVIAVSLLVAAVLAVFVFLIEIPGKIRKLFRRKPRKPRIRL